MLPAYSASARAIKIPARFREDEVLLYSEDYSKHQHWLPSDGSRGRELYDNELDDDSTNRTAVAPPLVRGPTPLDQQIALHQRNTVISGKTPQQLQIEAFYSAPPLLQVEAVAAGTTAAATAAAVGAGAAAGAAAGGTSAGLSAYHTAPRPRVGAEQVNQYYEQRQAQQRAYQLDLQKQRKRNQERFRLQQLQLQQQQLQQRQFQQQLLFHPYGGTFEAIPEEESTATMADSDLFLNDNPTTGRGNGQSFEDAMRIVAPDLAHHSDSSPAFSSSYLSSSSAAAAESTLLSSHWPANGGRHKVTPGVRRTKVLNQAKSSSSSSLPPKSLGPCTSFQPNCYCKTGRSRPVERYDPETGETLDRYCGIPDASRKLNLKYNNIMTHMHKRKPHVDGHYFRYEFHRTKSSSGAGGGIGGGDSDGGSGRGIGTTANSQRFDEGAPEVDKEVESHNTKSSSNSISLGSIKGIKVREVNQGSRANNSSTNSEKTLLIESSVSGGIERSNHISGKSPFHSSPDLTPLSSPSLTTRSPPVKKSPGGGTTAAKTATAVEVEEALARGPNASLVAHFLHFSLCQLRAQADRCLNQGAAFDVALSSLEPLSTISSSSSSSALRQTSIKGTLTKGNANNDDDDDDDAGMTDDDGDADSATIYTQNNKNGAKKHSTATTLSLADQFSRSVGALEEAAAEKRHHDMSIHQPSNDIQHSKCNDSSADIAACQPLMDLFFAGPALGDKWVPWSTALGSHELYIAQRIYGLTHLSDEEHYLLHFCFRGSSYEPCFEAVFAPLFEAPGADQPGHPNHARWKQVLHDPETAFAFNGLVHKRFMRYRRLGGGEKNGDHHCVDFMASDNDDADGDCDDDKVERNSEEDEWSNDVRPVGAKRKPTALMVGDTAAAKGRGADGGAKGAAGAAGTGKPGRKSNPGRKPAGAAAVEGGTGAGATGSGVTSALLNSVANRKRARAWELSVLAGTESWEVGAAVEVLHCDAWFSAKVVAIVPAGIKVHYNGGAVATIAVIRTADVAVRLRAPQNAANNNNNSSSKDSSKKDNSSNIGNSTSSSSSSTDTSKHKINKKNKTKNKALESSSTHSSTLSHNSSASGSCSSLATIGGVQLAEMPPWRTAPFPFPLPASLSTSTKATSDATGNHTNPVGAAAHLNSESSSGSNDGNGNEGAEYNGKSEIKSLSVKDDRIEGEGLESTVAVSHKRSRKNDDEVGAVDTSTTVAANATTPTNPPPLGKLHTSAYRAAPPKGASGDAFTWWICDRARNFIEVGREAYAKLQDMRRFNQAMKRTAASNSGRNSSNSSSSSNRNTSSNSSSNTTNTTATNSLNVGTAADGLCSLLCQHKGLGPTMSKMFLVTTHLRYPELELLDHSCQVGDGAEPALALLYDLMGSSPTTSSSPSALSPVATTAPTAAAPAALASISGDSGSATGSGVTAVVTKKTTATNLFPRETTLRLRPDHREQLLRGLHAYLLEHADILEPRLLPMVKWVVERTRQHLRGSVPEDSLPLGIAVFELQVNLCEWRKMLTQVDTSRCMRRGVSSSEVSAAAKKAGSGGGYNNHSNNKSNSDGSSNGNTTRVGKRLPLEVPMPTEATKPAEE